MYKENVVGTPFFYRDVTAASVPAAPLVGANGAGSVINFNTPNHVPASLFGYDAYTRAAGFTITAANRPGRWGLGQMVSVPDVKSSQAIGIGLSGSIYFRGPGNAAISVYFGELNGAVPGSAGASTTLKSNAVMIAHQEPLVDADTSLAPRGLVWNEQVVIREATADLVAGTYAVVAIIADDAAGTDAVYQDVTWRSAFRTMDDFAAYLDPRR